MIYDLVCNFSLCFSIYIYTRYAIIVYGHSVSRRNTKKDYRIDDRCICIQDDSPSKFNPFLSNNGVIQNFILEFLNLMFDLHQKLYF